MRDASQPLASARQRWAEAERMVRERAYRSLDADRQAVYRLLLAKRIRTDLSVKIAYLRYRRRT